MIVLLFIILYNVYNLLFIRLAFITHNSIAMRHPVTIISCGAFVEQKWNLMAHGNARVEK